MILSRAKPAVSVTGSAPIPTAVQDAKKKVPTLDTFISQRDYTGAITLLEFEAIGGSSSVEKQLWSGFAAFHLGDYKKAMEIYQKLLKDQYPDTQWHLYLACCYFFLGLYEEADSETQQGPNNKLQNRLLFHLAHKLNDEARLMQYHQKLQDIIEDQLTLASIHYLRSHYQEAIDIYKRLLLEHRDLLAINVYLALCYYKLEFYDVSQEVLTSYLQHYSDSVTALNLKACNFYRLYNGKAAEAEYKPLLAEHQNHFKFADDLIQHNLVVFRNGEGALKVLPKLLDVISEARLNLVIFHLRNEDTLAAYNLLRDLEPSNPQEYILKGIVNAALGHEQESKEHLKIAQQYFQLVGSSASECDTIPGRQCMASCFFLLGQFEDSLVYLNSIKTYFQNDDIFNYNFGQAKLAVGEYVEAEEALLLVHNEKMRQEYAYLSHLAKAYIMNKKPEQAWDLYLKLETSHESFSLVQLIANECYRTEQYLFAAKAFDVLTRLDPHSPDYWDAKRGACAGVMKQLSEASSIGALTNEHQVALRDVLLLLRATVTTNGAIHPQAEYMIRIIKKWAKELTLSVTV